MKLFLLLLLLAIAPELLAQESCAFVLTGQVIDEHDDGVLAYSELKIIHTSNGVVADKNGKFKFDNLCRGNLTLIISHIGCTPDTVKLTVKSDTNVIFYLEHHAELLKTLDVEAKRPHKDIASRDELTARDLAQNAGDGLAGLLDDMQGMQTLNTGGNISKPMIHGMHSNRLVIMSDNTKLQGQQWGSEHAPEVDPFSVERIEVVHGASSLRYGTEAMAGAIIAHSADISKERTLNGAVQSGISSNGQRGALSARINGAFFKRLPLFFSLQGSAINAGDLKAPNYYLLNTGQREVNGSGRLLWKGKNYGVDVQYKLLTTQLGILSYAHVGNLTDLEQIIERGQPLSPSTAFNRSINSPRQFIQHELSSAKLYWKPSLRNEWRLNVSRQFNLRQEFDQSIFSDADVADLQYEITTYQMDLLFEERVSSNYKYEVGIAGETQANTYTGRFFIPNFRNYTAGLFTIHHLNVGAWEVEAGVRYDYRWQQAFMYQQNELYSPIRSFSGFSWNAGVSHEWKRWEAMFNVGRAWRPPAINELYSGGLHHGVAAVEFGDESLREERMTSATLAIAAESFSIAGIPVEFNASTYVYWIENFIYLMPVLPPTLTIRGAFPTFNYASTNALFRGVDARLKLMPAKKVDLTFGAELVRADDVELDQPLIFIPPDRFDMEVNFIFWQRETTHKVGLSAAYTSRQNRVPVNSDYALPPDAFGLLGAQIQGEMHVFNTKPLYSFRIENALNSSYRSYLNRLRYYAAEQGRNFILTLKIPF